MLCGGSTHSTRCSGDVQDENHLLLSGKAGLDKLPGKTAENEDNNLRCLDTRLRVPRTQMRDSWRIKKTNETV